VKQHVGLALPGISLAPLVAHVLEKRASLAIGTQGSLVVPEVKQHVGLAVPGISLVQLDAHVLVQRASLAVGTQGSLVVPESKQHPGLAPPGISLAQLGAHVLVESVSLAVGTQGSLVVPESRQHIGLALPGISLAQLVAHVLEKRASLAVGTQGSLVVPESKQHVGFANPGMSLALFVAHVSIELSGVAVSVERLTVVAGEVKNPPVPHVHGCGAPGAMGPGWKGTPPLGCRKTRRGNTERSQIECKPGRTKQNIAPTELLCQLQPTIHREPGLVDIAEPFVTCQEPWKPEIYLRERTLLARSRHDQRSCLGRRES
jgi:hypothetical protein